MNIKDGYKTSEFWLALVGQLVSLAVLFGFISSDVAVEVQEVLGDLVLVVFALIALLPQVVSAVYVWGRSQLKIQSAS